LKKYFVWSPDRAERFARIQSAFVDEAGEEVSIYNGMPADQMPARLVGELTEGDEGDIVPDFVYDIGLLVIASLRVVDVMRSSDVAFSPVTLVYPDTGAEFKRYWVNPRHTVSMMDMERSTFRRSPAGVFRSIQHFVVQPNLGLDNDILLCDEIGLPVFSEQMVTAFHENQFEGAVFVPLESYTH
jgi:hypothetical protein